MSTKYDEKKTIIKMGAVIFTALIIVVVLIVIGVKNLNKNPSTSDIDSLFKQNVKSGNSKGTNDNNNVETTADSDLNSNIKTDSEKLDIQLDEIEVDDNIKNSINENKDIIVDNKPLINDKSDSFYSQIKEQIKKQSTMPDIDVKLNYYPKENYIKNATDNSGKLHIYNKNDILIYVPEGEYYDPVMQAFVTYNAYFKGILSFRAVNDPNKSDIRILLTDSLKDFNDGNAIGLGGHHKYDNNGNILYSELRLLNKNFHTNKDASKIQVYNTALHEIGHCIGIQGHSSNENDVMYKGGHSDKNIIKFSNRDIETIKLMYSGRKDLISQAIKNAQQEKLVENYKYALEEGHGSDSYLKLADSYMQSKQYGEAIEAYNRALKLNPENPRIYSNISNYYTKIKNYDRAVQYAKYGLTKAKTKEQRLEANIYIAQAYRHKKNYDNAIYYYNEALKENIPNDNYKIYDNLRYLYQKTNKIDNMIAAAKTSLSYAQTDVERASANNNIGYGYIKKKNYETALKYYGRAVDLAPSNKMYFVNYINTCYNLNNKKAAKEIYKKYIKNFKLSSFDENEKNVVEWAKN